MKRMAILIGNTNGLAGVQSDLAKFSAFLQSPTGGEWYRSEIDMYQNPSKTQLQASIARHQRANYDYVVVLFSGHGGYRRQTVLEINGAGELLDESALFGIASRQLSIFDCCRVVIEETVAKSMDSSASFREARSDVRARFDSRILAAIPQQARLYACDVGEYSYDTRKGAVYLGSLLEAATALPREGAFTLVGTAHAEAAAAVERKQPDQHPDAVLPKCLTSQQLILSMR
jgi:hypothetical protein